MKKKLRVLALVLAVALISSVTTGATLAWFTDKAESKLNVITTGNIDISLTEEVGVIGEGGVAKENTDGADYIEVMPGDYLKKEVKVANAGSNPAYVAVTVTLKNDNGDFANLLNKAIDDVYGDNNAQAWYDKVFDGWGLNHGKDTDGDGVDDAGMRLTITGDDMPENVLQVDSVKTITDYTQYYAGNWFGANKFDASFAGFYANGNDKLGTDKMGKYELRYTYYLYLESGESSVLFNGLNIPAEFDNDQIKMFSGLKIKVDAAAIQADNMGVNATYGTEAKTAFAILSGLIEPEDVVVDNTPERIPVADKAALDTAIANAKDGDVIVLQSDVVAPTLKVEKAVTIDLNGKTFTADNGFGVVTLKNGASIKNGTLDVQSNVAAICAFNVGTIENVTINISPKATEKVATAIAVQAGGHVDAIKNVTITGATQGIEVLNGASVGTIENVNVTAVSNGSKQGVALQIDAGNVGKVVNSVFNGEAYGVHMWLRGEFTVACELENCDVTGGTASVYAHDEVGIPNTNNCSLTLTYDAATELNGAFVWDFEDECLSVVTLNKP